MSPEDLKRRRPVWDAMSDLFLDTETRWDVPLVARICADSDYDDATLERIFWVEVFPEAIPNMLSIFGEWGALDLPEASLISRAKLGRMPWVRQYLWGRMVKSEWRAALDITRWLRPLDKDRRTQLVDALRLCGRRYFEAPDEPLFGVSQEDVDAVREIMADIWPRYEPLCRSMLLKSETPAQAARASAVRRLIDAAASPSLLKPQHPQD